jgi:hypothetical protein
VISATGPGPAEVDHFTLRTDDGQVMEFTVGRLYLFDGGLPSAHLRDHLATGAPITVTYHVENGLNIADRYIDAIAPPSPSQPPSTTAPPGTPSPPTATATAAATPPPTPTLEPTPIAPFHLGIAPFADGFQALTL